jgi:hypothetical protein
VQRIKRLEEGTWPGGNGTDTSTVAFGTGGGPSLSIKDGRDTTPACDQPIWTRTGVRIIPPTTIQDGRAPAPPAPSDLTIPDGRDYDSTMALLAEAVEARKAAANGAEFTRALAREQALRERLDEAGWTEALHPRARGGKWTDALGKFKVSPIRSGPGQALTPKARHPTIRSFVVSPGSKKNKVLVTALLHHGGRTSTPKEVSHDDAADWISGQMQMGENAAKSVRKIRRPLQEAIGPIKKGAFHAWLGKPLDQPITAADIAKGKAAGGHPAKMAHFAEQSMKWGKRGKKAAKVAA